MKIVDVNLENILTETLFCVKDIKSPGFKSKSDWFQKRLKEGLRIKILKNEKDKSIAFIEYTPAEFAWRPINADGYMFIHCMFTYSKGDRDKGYGNMLITACEEDAKSRKMKGVCVMTSNGTWITDKRLFEKNGYEITDQKGRFELMVKPFKKNGVPPELIDWTMEQKKYQGWNLVYSDQCPWHEKSVFALYETALDSGIDLKIKKLTTPKQAKKSPSGFGTFALLRDGRLLEDHYISQTRFKNILQKELSSN